MPTDRPPYNTAALAGFPADTHPILRRLPSQMGRLGSDEVASLTRQMGQTPRGLALAMLPLAQQFALPVVSGFRVGAVAVTRETGNRYALHLGANLEFQGLPLHHTIHAEQAAVANACNESTRELVALAVSAAPCGACRQFLLEASIGGDLEILLPARTENGRSRRLSELLPDAFGPAALRVDARLFAPTETAGTDLGATGPPDIQTDPLARIALQAAFRSYAPYTQSPSGCAIQLASGVVVSGGCVESAAYNPGLTAMQAALSRANLAAAHLPDDIERMVLADRAGPYCQSDATAQLLSIWAPQADLTIHRF